MGGKAWRSDGDPDRPGLWSEIIGKALTRSRRWLADAGSGLWERLADAGSRLWAIGTALILWSGTWGIAMMNWLRNHVWATSPLLGAAVGAGLGVLAARLATVGAASPSVLGFGLLGALGGFLAGLARSVPLERDEQGQLVASNLRKLVRDLAPISWLPVVTGSMLPLMSPAQTAVGLGSWFVGVILQVGLGVVFVMEWIGGHELMARSASGRDIQPAEFGKELDWATPQAATSLTTLCSRVKERSTEAIHWYLGAKEPMKQWARGLRVGAILSGATAGVIPLLTQIYSEGGKPAFQPAWSGVALALGALLIALDHFLGCSSAWMRYITVQQDIRRALEEFQIDWEIERSSWANGQPSNDQVQRGLTLFRGFVTRVNTALQQETSQWVSEFQSVLKVIDDGAKAQREYASPGGVTVVVANPQAAANQAWALSIDGGTPRACTGATAAEAGLLPGVHRVRIEGQDAIGRRLAAEDNVSVPAGGAVQVRLTLT